MSDPVLELRDADPAADVRTAPPATCSSDPRHAPQRPSRRAGVFRGSCSARLPSPPPRWSASPRSPPARVAGPIRASLAQRAYAATAPLPDSITYTETTTVQTGNPRTESYDKLRQWQYGDRMHNFMETRRRAASGSTARPERQHDPHADAQRKRQGGPGHPQDRPRLGPRGLRVGLQGRRHDLGGPLPRAHPQRAGPGGDTSTASAPTRTVPSGARTAAAGEPIYYVDPRRRSRSATRRPEPLQAELVRTASSNRAIGRAITIRRPSIATSTSSRRPRT